MKRKVILALTVLMTVTYALGGCGQKETNGEESDVSKSEETEINTSVTNPSLLPEGQYEANLPEDVILSIGDKETSILNKLGSDIMAELGIEDYGSRTNFDPAEYPDGVPYWYSFGFSDVDSVSTVVIDERFYVEEDKDVIRVQQFSLSEISFAKRQDVSFLGLTYESSFEDVYEIFGNPDEIHGDEKGYRDCYLEWNEIVINEQKFKLYVTFSDETLDRISIDLSY